MPILIPYSSFCFVNLAFFYLKVAVGGRFHEIRSNVSQKHSNFVLFRSNDF